MTTNVEWEYFMMTTDLHFRVTRSLVRRWPTNWCTMLVANVITQDGHDEIKIPCLHCAVDHLHLQGDSNHYYQHYAQVITSTLRHHFLDLSESCAKKVSDTFTEIVRSTNVTHHCLNYYLRTGEVFPDSTMTVHRVEIYVVPQGVGAISESTFVEAAGTRYRPATEESVRDLLKTVRLEEFLKTDLKCVICLEEMDTRRSALMMPCSHLFHQPCLLQWLNSNHVCPLCRYEMPSEY